MGRRSDPPPFFFARREPSFGGVQPAFHPLNRRRLGAGAAGLLLADCAGLRPLIQVNASQSKAAAPETTADQAQLGTGADASQRITAPIRINGEGPFNFVVDTGANSTVVSTELAARLGLPPGGPAQVHGVAGVEAAPTAILDRLEVDAVAATTLRVPVLSRERLGADGLLGVDVMHDRRVLINFLDRRLSIGPERGRTTEASSFDMRQAQTGAARDLGRRVAVPARYRFGQLIIVDASVPGHGVTAFVDTGSQSTVGNNALRAVVSRDLPNAPRAARLTTPVLSATGQIAQGEIAPMPPLRLGGMDITGLTTVFADLHVFQIWDLMKRPSLMLGMDILSRFNALELNYARREVVFYLADRSRSR